jgi:hypothetical protein
VVVNRRRVEVRIDSLVLRGFTSEQRDAVAASLRVELERVLGAAVNDGEFRRDVSVASVRLGEVRAPRDGFAAHIGQIVARGVAREMPR